MEKKRTLISNDTGFEGKLKTDFEKLIIAERIIKAMHYKAGIMESDAAELVSKCKALKEKIAMITATTREEKLAIKVDAANQRLKLKQRKLELIIRDSKRSNEELISKIVELQGDQSEG